MRVSITLVPGFVFKGKDSGGPTKASARQNRAQELPKGGRCGCCLVSSESSRVPGHRSGRRRRLEKSTSLVSGPHTAPTTIRRPPIATRTSTVYSKGMKAARPA